MTARPAVSALGPGARSSPGGCKMQRRDFLVRTGLALGAGAFTGFGRAFAGSPAEAPARAATIFDDWDAVRALFNLSRDRIHLASFFLPLHPQPVREAIDRHLRALVT